MDICEIECEEDLKYTHNEVLARRSDCAADIFDRMETTHDM